MRGLRTGFYTSRILNTCVPLGTAQTACWSVRSVLCGRRGVPGEAVPARIRGLLCVPRRAVTLDVSWFPSSPHTIPRSWSEDSCVVCPAFWRLKRLSMEDGSESRCLQIFVCVLAGKTKSRPLF